MHRSRKTTEWFQGPNSEGQDISTTGSTLWTNGIALAGDQVTLARIRGHIMM